jgi:hypothetical protein
LACLTILILSTDAFYIMLLQSFDVITVENM